MSEASFPGPGPDGEQPPPVGPARDEAAGLPAGMPADDWDGDAAIARYIADLDAGRAWIPPPDGGGNGRDGPDPAQAAALADFLRGLNITVTPIANGSCDHVGAEDRYVPSRKLKGVVRARTARCTAPGCGAQAVHCDLDHTRPYPAGLTCQCDLSPACRRHHRCKQAPGWTLEQPEPGVMRWTTPSRRTHTTRPTVYDS